MEPRVAAFLNSAIRWALKDFEPFWLWGRSALRQTRARPGRRVPCGLSRAPGLRAEPAQALPRRVF